MTDIAVRDTPYKGLFPYDEIDSSFFFGREPERNIIAANLLGSRLTLVYGPSGVGKSSVLQAGVVHDLRELALDEMANHGKPKFIVVFFNAWRDEPLSGLLAQCRHEIGKICGKKAAVNLQPATSFANTLKQWSDSVDSKFLIILDQFEEYFLYSQRNGLGSFAEEFPNAVNRADLRANFIISLREDWYTKLDRFKVPLPNIFDNNLRVEWLNHEAARLAIEEPARLYNRLRREGEPRVEIESGFSEKVLQQLEALSDKDVLGDSGSGEVKSSSANGRSIQTPYLQLVMTRLWGEAIQAEDHVLRPEMLDKPHDPTKAETRAEEIIQSHLDGVMQGLEQNEQDVASLAFYHLVTPGGTKIAQQIGDLKDYTGLPEHTLNGVLEKLSSKEMSILSQLVPAPNRPANQVRYEVSHDVLAPAILSWRKSYILEKEKAEATRLAAEEAARAAQKAASKEREAAHLLRLQQAEALAEAERLRAEEQAERAKVEQLRAEEQAKLAKVERLRASDQERRAVLQAMHSKRLRWLIAAMALMFLLGSAAAIAAFRQSRIADRQTSEVMRLENVQREERTQFAERQRLLAEQRLSEREKAMDDLRRANDKAVAQTRLAERKAREAEIASKVAVEARRRETLARKEVQAEKEKLEIQNEELKRLRARDKQMADRNQELAKAESLNSYGFGLFQGGTSYERAISAHTEALRQYRLLKEPNGVANTLTYIARAYAEQAKSPEVPDREAKIAKAEGYYRQAMTLREQISPDSNELARAINYLGVFYDNQDRHNKEQQALALYQRALEIRKKINTNKADPTSTFELFISHRNLASVYQELGRYSDAIEVADKALEVLRHTTDSKNDMDLADITNRLGMFYYFQGKYDQAEAQYKDALRINKTAWGTEHPNVAINMHNLGLLYFQKAKYKEAKELEEEALRISRKATVIDHDLIAISLMTLARLYREQDNLPAAEKNYQEAIGEMITSSGRKGRRVGVLKHYQAEFYAAQGDTSRAEEIEQEALASLREGYGTDHWLVSRSLSTLAEIREKQGKRDEAESLYKQALDNLRVKLGADHPEVAATQTGLAKLYIAEGRYSEAELLLNQALAIRERIEPNHPYVADVLESYSTLLQHTGRESEAKEKITRAQSIREKVRAAYEK